MTLTPSAPFALTNPVQLVIGGNPPAGLKDVFGRFIDGDHNGKAGGNAIAVLSKSGVHVSAIALARRATISIRGRNP